jgi:transposase
MEACSLDLRERIVRAVDEGHSRLSVAERFQVSNALVGKLLRQRRQTGSISPKPHAGGRRPALDAAGLEAVRQLVRAQPDATLAELCERLGGGGGGGDARGRPRVGVNPVCRALRRLGLPLKKRRFTPTSATPGA